MFLCRIMNVCTEFISQHVLKLWLQDELGLKELKQIQ